MGIFKKACKILEFHKILQMLSKYLVCEENKRNINSISPSLDLKLVEEMSFETDEALVILTRFSDPGFFDVLNPAGFLKKAKQGIYFNCLVLLNMGKILKQTRVLSKFFRKHEENFNYLTKYFKRLKVNEFLENLILKSIISDDEISDDASFELFNVRNMIRNKKNKIRNILDDFVKGENKKFLQENIITLREGRHVLAVKAEYVKEISGLVHDVSSSGATVFLEPSLVVSVDNELKILYKKEEEEKIKILKNLTDKCLEFCEELIINYDEILKLDLIFAKAKLASFMKALKPKFSKDGEISLKKARHPLIDSDVVVPIDVEFGGGFKNIIISGPNTGGKTVALKTIGLLTIMAMCGFLIPAAENSKLTIFNKILIAIGDEQSIENSLSTFSAHIKSIIYILNAVDCNSLVLIDEIASGTDPEQGAALAVAIVKQICLKKATLAATTHYMQLKTFAFNNDFVKNARFEFNLNSLEPTYKLIMGSVGQSNAFEISKKLGMPNFLIDSAKKYMSKRGLYLNYMLSKIEGYKKYYKNRIELLKQYDLKLKQTEKELEEKKQNLDYEMKKQFDFAKQKAVKIVEDVNVRANEILNELKEIKKNKTKGELSNLISRTKSIVKKSVTGLYKDINADENFIDGQEENCLEKLDVGDLVLVCDLNKKATVLDEVDGNKKVLVQIGGIKMRIEINKMKLLQKKVKKDLNVSFNKRVVSKKNREVKTEIDLRGYCCDEALLVLDRFIDGCVLNNLSIITIIHGKGTGALKNAVTKHLKKHPSILNSRFGVFGEGEDGVTIAELK